MFEMNYNQKAIRQYRGEIIYIFSSIVAPIISIIGSIVASIFIAPGEMGVICNCLLISTYASFIQLGVFNGLNRNIAFYKAQNKQNVVQNMVNTSHMVAVCVAAIGCAISVVYALCVVGKGGVYIAGSILLLITLAFTPLSTHYETTYRSGQEFKRLGIIKFKESLLYCIVVFLPSLLGYLGKIISDSLKLLVGFFLRLKDLPIKSTGRGQLKTYKELVRTGFPMLLSGYVWSIFQVADQTYISAYFGEEQLGLYTLSRYCVMAFIILPQAINAVLYPKAAARFGQTGNSYDLLPFWRKTLILYSAIIIPIVVVLYVIAPILVPIVLPKYVDGIDCMKINLISCITFIYMGPSVIFGTLRKNTAYIISIIICLCLFWIIALSFQGAFCNSESVAYLKLSLSVALAISSIILSRYYINKKNK